MTTATAQRRTVAARALADAAAGLGVRAFSLNPPLANVSAEARALVTELRAGVVDAADGVRRPDEKTWAEALGTLLRREREAGDGPCPHCQQPVRVLPDQVTLEDVLLDPLPHPGGDVRIVDVAGYVRAARDRRHLPGRGIRYRRHRLVCPRWPRGRDTCPVCGTRLHQLLLDDEIDTHPRCAEGTP